MGDTSRSPEQLAKIADRIAYKDRSYGDEFRPRGFYWRRFAVWHAGSRLRSMPFGLRQLGMLARNLRVFWVPRRLEFRYMSDGFATKARFAFLNDEDFIRAYERMILAAGYPADPGLHLRIHQAVWAASVAKHLKGDFVECGTGRGMVFSAVLESLSDWDSLNKTLWLFDTFSPYHLNPKTGKPDVSLGIRDLYARDVESTRQNFADWPRVRCVEGTLPDTLDTAEVTDIAFLHIDLNYAQVEKAVLRRLWPRVVSGGIVLLDDYGQNDSQNQAMNEVARELGVKVLTTGSAQGIIIKP